MLSLQTVAEAWLHPGSRHLSTSSAVCPGWIYKSSVSALRMDGRGGTGQLSPSTPHYHIKHFYDRKCSWFPHIKRCPDTRWVFSNLTQFWHQLPSQHQILRLKSQSHKTASPPYPPPTSISDTNHKSRLTAASRPLAMNCRFPQLPPQIQSTCWSSSQNSGSLPTVTALLQDIKGCDSMADEEAQGEVWSV